MFKIHSNLEMPVYTAVGRPTVEYPFAELQVRDNFFVPILGEEDVKQVIARVRAKAQRWKKQSGLVATKIRVTKAVNPDTGTDAVGVWRTA